MKKMLIFGGTGSLGKSLISHLLEEYEISVFSRDEAKHVVVKNLFPVRSLIGDVRDRDAVTRAIFSVRPDVVINASALKNVPEVEEVPMEGIKTSLFGTENINTAVSSFAYLADTKLKVLTVSTDKACKPVNSYGMAKALQERLHIRSNTENVICNAVRYGNVLQSRGSLIPILSERFKAGQPVSLTHQDMTRFFLTLDASVELIKVALEDTVGGNIFIPKIVAARIADVIDVLRDYYDRPVSDVRLTSIRPGEKLHEQLVSQEETLRCENRGDVYLIHDILSEKTYSDLTTELSSNSTGVLMSRDETAIFFSRNGIL